MWIEALRRTPLAEVGADVFDSSVAWLLSDFARHQLGRNLKSRALLEQLQLP